MSSENMAFLSITEEDKKLPFNLVSVGCFHNQEKIVRPNGYPYYQWIQCYDGEGELEICETKEKFSVKKGQGMFLFPHEAHTYYSVSDKWMIDWVVFQGYGVEEYLKSTVIKKSGVYYTYNHEIIISRMRKILNAALSRNGLNGIECSENLYGLLLDLNKYVSLKNVNDSKYKQYTKIKPTIDYINNNYEKYISLETMGDIIGVTPEHMCLLFKNTINMRPFEYLNRIRINKSKDILINNKNLKIYEISQMVGYEDTSYYCSIFKKYEGITPGMFKELY